MRQFYLFVVLVALLLFSFGGSCQTWTDLPCVVNGGTHTIITDGTNLYMGGTFSQQVSMYNLTGVCSGLGYNGVNADVRGMAWYNGELYVSGLSGFSVDSGYVYKYSGGIWSEVIAFGGQVNTMEVYSGSLYIGGAFGMPAGSGTLARFNGSTWSVIYGGFGIGEQVRALKVYNNELIIAGDNFPGNIVKWNGTNISALGTGISGTFFPMVMALETHNGLLYTSGKFDMAGNTPVSNIAAWNGTTWSSPGTGITGGDTLVLSLASYNGKLYAGGLFSSAGGITVSNIASWNGSAWGAVGAGNPTSAVSAMIQYEGSLIIASGYNGSTSYYRSWSDCASVITAGSTTSFCGGSVNLNAGPGTAYQWLRNNNYLVGATAAAYNVTLSGTYFCLITTTCGIVPSNNITVNANLLPVATIQSSGPLTFCDGDSVTLSATNGPAQTYQWRLNGNNISGATSTALNVIVAGSYTCRVTNACGASTSNTIIVVVNGLPSASITPSGPLTFCIPNSVTLNANIGTGLTYQWIKYGIPIAGATAASLVVTTSGNYKVMVTNTAGCALKSAAITVTVSGLPQATITPTGATTFCLYSSVTLNANTGTGLSYQWIKYGIPISGATSASLVVTATGSYKVMVTNASGCTRKSAAVSVTVNPLPTASIIAGGSTSICAGDSVMLTASTNIAGSTFEWKKNNILINNAITSVYAAKSTGAFKAIVTSPAGCKKGSNTINVNVVCRLAAWENDTQSPLVYPNPVNNILTIDAGTDAILRTVITTTNGRRVFEDTGSGSSTLIQLDLSELQPGVYFVLISTGNNQFVEKIIKY